MSDDEKDRILSFQGRRSSTAPSPAGPPLEPPGTKPDERYRLGIYPLAGGQDIILTRALFDLILSRLTEATQNEQRALAFRLKNTVECGGDV